MKCVKVLIKRGKAGEEMMVYPPLYNAQEVDRNGIGPLGVNQVGAYSGHIGNGGSEEWCIIILDDALAATYAGDPGMEIVTDIQADALMEQWRVEKDESEEVITDMDLITYIQKKQAMGDTLAADDLRALDPDDSMRGINKRLRKVADVTAKVAV